MLESISITKELSIHGNVAVACCVAMGKRVAALGTRLRLVLTMPSCRLMYDFVVRLISIQLKRN